MAPHYISKLLIQSIIAIQIFLMVHPAVSISSPDVNYFRPFQRYVGWPYRPTNWQPNFPVPVNESSGTRFGNVKFSRHEYNTLPGRHGQKSALSVEFKTLEADGIIFYASDHRNINYTALYLKDGKLHFSFNCGTGPAFLVSPETYNDNQWHVVKFNRDRQNAALFVDAKLVDVGSSPGIAQTIDADQPYFLGGISPEVLNSSRHNFKGVEGGFNGCLRNFLVGSHSLSEPSYIEGTEPCSTREEKGSFFSADGGYIKAEENFQVGLGVTISMEIKPRSSSGILMSVHGRRRDFLLLQMVNGSMIFSVDNGGGPIVSTYSPLQENDLRDGKWHYIQAIKARNVVTLSVDYELVKPGIGRSGGHSTDTSNPLFIGGNPNSNQLRGIRTNEQFVGCIRNVIINGKSLHFNSSQVMGSVRVDSCLTI